MHSWLKLHAKFKHSELIYTGFAFQNSALNELLVTKYENRKQQKKKVKDVIYVYFYY